MKLQWNPIPILLHLFLLQITLSTAFSPSPMNCTDTTRMCTSFLALKPEPNETMPVIQSLLPKINHNVLGVKSGGAGPALHACLSGEGSGDRHSSPSRGFATGDDFQVKNKILNGSDYKKVTVKIHYLFLGMSSSPKRGMQTLSFIYDNTCVYPYGNAYIPPFVDNVISLYKLYNRNRSTS